MLFNKKFLYPAKVIVLLLIIIWLIYKNNDKQDYVESYQEQINALNSKIDSLHSINDDLTYKIDTLNTQIITLDKEINVQDNRIQTLKWKINEKVTAVDNFNNDELYKFFSERYRQYIDSIGNSNSKISN